GVLGEDTVLAALRDPVAEIEVRLDAGVLEVRFDLSDLGVRARARHLYGGLPTDLRVEIGYGEQQLVRAETIVAAVGDPLLLRRVARVARVARVRHVAARIEPASRIHGRIRDGRRRRAGLGHVGRRDLARKNAGAADAAGNRHDARRREPRPPPPHLRIMTDYVTSCISFRKGFMSAKS